MTDLIQRPSINTNKLWDYWFSEEKWGKEMYRYKGTGF